MNYLKENNEDIAGFPFAIHHPCKEEGYIFLECGLPVGQKLAGNEKIEYKEIPAGKHVVASHFGHFKTVQITYDAAQKYIEENNLEMDGIAFQMYVTDPMKEPDQSKWETKVYFPIK